MFDVAAWGYGVAAAAYGLFCLYLFLGWRKGKQAAYLLAACLGTGVWAAAGGALASRETGWGLPLVVVLDLLRNALWFAFLLSLLRPLVPHMRTLLWVTGAALLFSGSTLVAAILPQVGGTLGTLASLMMGFLALAVVGLMLVEQLYRNLPAESRWGLKPLCLGLSAAYIFDLYFFADGLLFGRLDRDIWAVKGLIALMILPLVALSAARSPTWTLKIRVSREVAFHSTALALSGLYLLAMAGAGYYVRYFGGDWGRALQTLLMFGGILLLGVLFFSGSQRARLRVFINKHLFPYRYDYRTEWLKFTQALSSADDSLDLGQSVIKALSDQVESSGGVLWLRDESDRFKVHARLNHPQFEAEAALDSPLCRFLDDREWVINLEEWRTSPVRYEGMVIPEWVSEMPDAWLIVPLKAAGGLIGFVVLNTARTRFEINWEVLDLLKTAQRQAASYLAQMLAAEALLESRKFDSFNRMSAFVVHDLKNLVAQLSLMLKNAERHRDNPEFQADMIDTIAHVEERMRGLMKQLQEKSPVDPRRPVEIAGLLQRICLAKRHQRPVVALVCDVDDVLMVNAHPERLERVIGHVVQNALDATDESGKVSIRLERPAPDSVAVVVEDTGRGMSEEFIREQLFKPFRSSKASGMGLGVYEAQQYLKELGGAIQYWSESGRGTRATVVLPTMDAKPQAARPAKSAESIQQ